MRCLLIYDISHDGVRDKVANACLDYGLERIQYSAFMGELNYTHQKELLLKIRKRLGKEQGNIQLYPLHDISWSKRIVILQKRVAKKVEEEYATEAD